MPIAPAATWNTFLLVLLLVVSTGTAWFTALHPGFVWRVMQGNAVSEEGNPFIRLLRRGGILFGAAGLLLLFLSDYTS